MSLKRKDISSSTSSTSGGLRVATDEPHLVSLGGGRLSTAVTIHQLPIGKLTIGSSPSCGVVLCGSGVQTRHCTLYRSESNEVTLVPEMDARTLVDGDTIVDETVLSQGAMLTIGKSNYLRFNNPVEAQMIKSTMGCNERISMPQLDFTQNSSSSNEGSPEEVFQNLNDFLESHNYQSNHSKKSYYEVDSPTANLNNCHSPKVFTAESITVNAPAKDVLGAKYNNFAKNLPQNSANYSQNNVNGKFIGPNLTLPILTKVNNNLMTNGSTSPSKPSPISSCYDRYPKPGSYGTLQVYPMNGVNINSNSEEPMNSETQRHIAQIERMKEEEISKIEQERLEEIIKMCAEYDNQNSPITNSPIVQNRIKTNGSLPRDKKVFGDLSSSSFSDHSSASPLDHKQNVFFSNDQSYMDYPKKSSSGYENVSFVHDRVVIGNDKKYVPQSPRTKIKTCVSPKANDRRNEYDFLAQSFEDRLNMFNSIVEQNNKLVTKKYDGVELKMKQEKTLKLIRELKSQIAELKGQEDEVFQEYDLEKVLVSAELTNEVKQLHEMEINYQKLMNKLHRLEAHRNSNRVMQETQQTKLKHSIDVKEDHIDGIEKMIYKNMMDEALADELNTTQETLENDKKMFEDLEFQYLEEETEWMAQREELNKEIKILVKHIDENKMQIRKLERSSAANQQIATSDTKILETNLISLLKQLEKCREELKLIDYQIFEFSGKPSTPTQTESDDDQYLSSPSHLKLSQYNNNKMFGSTEILSSANTQKYNSKDLMSKSVNENLIFSNNIIEMSGIEFNQSTPNKSYLLETRSLSLSTDSLNRTSKSSSPSISSKSPTLFHRHNSSEPDPLLKLKYNLSDGYKSPSGNLNLLLESDDFEVNPLDKRVPSQDDIDRISKVTLDAPITTMQGASYKVKESIREIERNRQLLLAQQGSSVIEHERQKMSELKKKSYEEARVQYMQLHNAKKDDEEENSGDSSYLVKDNRLEELPNQNNIHLEIFSNTVDDKNDSSNQQRHSHPEFDSNQHRPLSEISEASYDPLIDKQFHSTNDITNSLNNVNGSGSQHTTDDSNRNSFASQNEEQQLQQQQQTLNSRTSRLKSGIKRNNVQKSQRPLTRYLPIMSSHLDLRQHVEKAGHQITLCPHVVIDECCCRGYLHKLGATFHGWSKRWFVFDRQKRALIYYSDKSERKPRGGAYFTTIDDVYLDHLNITKSGRPHCTFIVKTKKRSYHLQAASDAAARIWIDVIITGAQGNIDY